MKTEWDKWQLCTSVCAKPEVGISPHLLWRPLGEHLQKRVSHFTMEEKVQQRVH